MKKSAIAIIVIIIVAGSAVGGYFLFYDPAVPEDEPNVAYYAYESEPILNWDPAICFSDGIIVLNNVYETLLKYDPTTDDFDYVLSGQLLV